MSREEQILVKHIKEIEAKQELELEFEIWADDMGYEYSQEEQSNKWMKLADRKYDLMVVLAEIRGCDVLDLVLE